MPAATLFVFKRRTALALAALLFFAVFAFGATDPWAFPVIAGGLLGLIALWALRMVRHPYPVRMSWFYLPLAIPPAAGALQLALGRTASRYQTAGEVGWWIAYLVFFALMVNVLDDIALRRITQRRLAYLGGVVSAAAIVQWMVSPRAAYGLREAPGAMIFGPFADADNFAFLIELLFPGALLLAFRDGERKPALFLSCTLMIAAVVLSGSALGRAVVAGEFVIGLGVVMYFAARSMSLRVWGKHALLTVVGALAVALTVILGFGADEIRERLELGLDPVEAPGFFVLTRSDVVSISWDLIQQQPALGYGLGAFAPVFATSAPRRDGFHWEHGYSDPVELTVELGAAGVALQLIVLALILFGRRELRAWGAFALPLAIVWAHSWVRSPLRTPALVLVALSLLAMLPAARRRRSAQAA